MRLAIAGAGGRMGRALIDAALAAPERASGAQTGTMRDGALWRLAVEPVSAAAPPDAAASGLAYGLRLEIVEDGGTVLLLETVGVGR